MDELLAASKVLKATIQTTENHDSEKLSPVDVAVANLGTEIGIESFITAVRKLNPSAFICIFSKTAACSAQTRQWLFDIGCKMVSESQTDVITVLKAIDAQLNSNGSLVCPKCFIGGLSPQALYDHMPLYHINDKLIPGKCPVCLKSEPDLQLHIHKTHNPSNEYENDTAGPLYAFGLVVCRRESDGKYLLVQEFCSSGYWLPGGRVNMGESLKDAAIRETLEEAGVQIELTGILAIEYHPKDKFTRMRIIFSAKPSEDSALPKSIPDFESCGAVWVAPEEIPKLKLRGMEPLLWCVNNSERLPDIHPLSVLIERK
ncbi:hypothetical protein HK096_007219 [Nowakowskiella sp. JEL0078]|nr:hypothetical protein HK096_007219 [Nowakowskiella sp. JEL0078]